MGVMARLQFKKQAGRCDSVDQAQKRAVSSWRLIKPGQEEKGSLEVQGCATREVQIWQGGISLMPGPMLTIVDLLRGAADALEEAYRGREDVPPASLALIVALRERVRAHHIRKGRPG